MSRISASRTTPTNPVGGRRPKSQSEQAPSSAIALSAALAYARLTGSQVHDEWGIANKDSPADPGMLLHVLATTDASDSVAAADALTRRLGVSFG